MPIDPRIPLGGVLPKINTPAEMLGQIGELQDQRQRRLLIDQQIRSGQATEDDRRAQMEVRARAAKDEQTLDALYANAFDEDPDTGIKTFKRGLVETGLTQGGNAHLLPQTLKDLDAMDQSARAMAKERRAMVARAFHNITTHGNTPEAALSNFAYLKENGAVSPEKFNALIEAVGADRTPAGIAAVVARVGAVLPEYGELANAEAKRTADLAHTEAQTAGLVDTPRHNKALEDAARTTAERGEAARLEAVRHTGVTEANDAARLGLERERVGLEGQRIVNAANDKTDLSPAGLDAAAQMFAKTGQLPALGNSDKGTRKAIINRAAELMPGLDVATAKADYGANTAALKTLQTNRSAISAFEKTASKNVDIFLEQAGKVVDTGSPLANTAIRLVSGKMLGSPDQAAYEAARQVAINEIAKITNGGGLSGVLSDSARHEIAEFNPENATLKQTVAVMRLLKRDMANRASSLDDEIGAITTRIRKGIDPVAAAPAKGITVTDPTGTPHTFATQAAADAFKTLAGIR